jgi:hypothetical protein
MNPELVKKIAVEDPQIMEAYEKYAADVADAKEKGEDAAKIPEPYKKLPVITMANGDHISGGGGRRMRRKHVTKAAVGRGVCDAKASDFGECAPGRPVCTPEQKCEGKYYIIALV